MLPFFRVFRRKIGRFWIAPSSRSHPEQALFRRTFSHRSHWLGQFDPKKENLVGPIIGLLGFFDGFWAVKTTPNRQNHVIHRLIHRLWRLLTSQQNGCLRKQRCGCLRKQWPKRPLSQAIQKTGESCLFPSVGSIRDWKKRCLASVVCYRVNLICWGFCFTAGRNRCG